MCTCGMLNIIRIIDFFLKNGKFELLRLQTSTCCKCTLDAEPQPRALMMLGGTMIIITLPMHEDLLYLLHSYN